VKYRIGGSRETIEVDEHSHDDGVIHDLLVRGFLEDVDSDLYDLSLFHLENNDIAIGYLFGEAQMALVLLLHQI
jgi:hypothetical protein